MQIHQILVRPQNNTVVILHDDAVGSRHSVIVDSSGNATVSALVAYCVRLASLESWLDGVALPP
jgi:hypothetical protein